MKYKFGLTLFFVVMLAFASFAGADVTSTATVDLTADQLTPVPGATKVVIGAYTLHETGAADDQIDGFKITDTGNALAGKVKKLSIYIDKNSNEQWDATDELIPTATANVAATVDMTAAANPVTITLTTKKSIESGTSLKVLVVADLWGAGWDDGTTTLGAKLEVSNTGADAGANLAAFLGVAQTPQVCEVTASHLKWLETGFEYVVAAGTDLTKAGAFDLFAAVDDFGNIDEQYAGKAKISAVNFWTGDDINTVSGLSATIGAADCDADFNVQFALGKVTIAAGDDIHFNATAGPRTLVISAENNATGKGLVGTTTVTNGARPATTGVDPARGIEVYDMDHNGHIDHMTVIFNGPVDFLAANSVVPAHFSIGSQYTINSVVGSKFDAGGIGIRNVGEYGFTVELVEKDAFDTDATPDLALANAAGLKRLLDNAIMNPFTFAQAKEVDRARPILISAITKDAGYGTGSASNGILDGIVMTFSEPVQNIKPGSVLSANGASTKINIAIRVEDGMSLTGAVTSAGTVVTLPVSETTINTGITPILLYNEDDSWFTDSAQSATGATSPNKFYAANSQFELADVDAEIATTDGAPMVVHSVETLDTDADGRLDKIRVTFSEDTSPNMTEVGVDFASSTSAFASGAQKDGVYKPVDLSPVLPAARAQWVQGGGTPTLEFGIQPVSVDGVYDTEATPVFRYDPNFVSGKDEASNIADKSGNELQAYGPGGLTHSATRDMAAPVIVKFTTNDAYTDTTYVGGAAFQSEGADGRIDKVTVVFSEKVKSSGGAQNGGTALDNALSQFTVTHQEGPALTVQKTTANFGKPVWEDKDNAGDTSTEVQIAFSEVSLATANLVNGGDTGKNVRLNYAKTTASYNLVDYAAEANLMADKNNIPGWVDGAAPFIVNGLGRSWHDKAFKNVATYDKPVNTNPRAGSTNIGDGDGFLEGFVLKFTEPVTFTATGTALRQFATTVTGGGELIFNHDDATVVNNGDGTVTLIGKRKTAGSPDTGTAPALTYTKNDDVLVIKDASALANKLASFTDRPSFDAVGPVIVGVYGDVAQANKLNFTFSEPVYAHDADGKNISFNAANVTSSSLFGYQNTGAGVGASGFSSASVVQSSPTVLQATLNANMTLVDIQNDLVWVRSATIFDDANVNEDGFEDNKSGNDTQGGNFKFWIMDDVVAPWITNASTVDFDLDGKVDHIRFTFSENIQDATIKGFVSDNAMSDDVSATWKLSGYTGPARWNLFNGTKDEGKAAAIAAGKPAFSDNAKDDNVLYLELDEEVVPANANSGVGSTGFKPTVTWGTGAAAETMGDARPNVLNTAKNPDDTAGDLKATNGTVLDKIGPAIVGASLSGKTIRVLFSEPIKDATKAYKTDDFKVDGGNQASIWGITWVNDSTVDITMKSNYTFSSTGNTTVEVAGGVINIWGDVTTESTNYASLADAAGNRAGLSSDKFVVYNHVQANANNTFGGFSPFSTTAATVGADEKVLLAAGGYIGQVYASWDGSGSPINNAGVYPTKVLKRGAFAVTNNAWIVDDGSTPTTVSAGSAVTLKWKFANIDQVEVYQSFNSGVTYELVPGSQVAASAKTTTWTAKMGVTHVKVQGVNAGPKFVVAVNVVFDGNTVGSSIGAPSALSVYDVPNDNGGFAYAQFTKSADHLTAVNSYQFYREVTVVDSTKAWVLWATVAAGTPDADGKLTVIIPTIWNDNSSWKVAASTGKLLSEGVVAAKVAADAIPVAEVVYNAGAAKAAAVESVSQFSDVATGASIDNIAPSALTSATAADNDGAGTGVVVSWVAPADHGIVASYTLNGVTNYIYGVDSYEVFRKAAGTQEFVLAGTAGSGSTSFTDAVADGATIYSYLVKAVDSAHSVETVVPGRVMAGNGTSDFNADGAVSLGDLVLLGNMWGLKNTSSDFVANFDLNKDGQISVGDLVLLGGAWTPTSAKVAKAAGEVPMSNIAFQMVSSVSEGNKMYYVSINTKDAASINAVSFSLKYDASKFEFVSDSVTGLGDIPLVKADQAGIIDIASLYQNEKFNGTVTLGFKAKDAKSDMNVEMVNAEVALNGVVSSAKNAETVMLKALPQTYALSQNFPNPFNPTTTIEYSIPTTGNVSLVIYNVAGQKIRTLVNGNQSANYYKVIWDGKNDNGMTVGTGTYFYKLVSGNYSKIVKMTLMK